MPGNGAAPAGAAIPLLNGVKDAPIGITAGDSGVIAVDDSEKIGRPNAGAFAVPPGGACGWSNS